MANVKDPVCGMEVDPAKAPVHREEYASRTYYFCSGACQRQFRSSPQKYAS